VIRVIHLRTPLKNYKFKWNQLF